MIRPLEFELKAYARERARLESAYHGKFVLIQGDRIAAIFDDFETASEHASTRLQGQSYLIHHIGADMTRALAFADALSVIDARNYQRLA